MNKTKNLIIKILEEKEEEIDTKTIEKELKERNHNINYDSVCRNLKSLFEECVLNRIGKGNETYRSTGTKHWKYYYSLKN